MLRTANIETANIARFVPLIVSSAIALATAGCCCCSTSGNFGPPGGYAPEPSEHIITVTDENFDELVLGSDKPVLVDFWASWCKPCEKLDPAVVAMAEENHERLTVARVNVDESPQTASEYEVHMIPTLALFHNGQLVARQLGEINVPDITGNLRQWLQPKLEELEPAR